MDPNDLLREIYDLIIYSKAETKLDKSVRILKSYWWKITLFIVSAGIIILFATSLAYHEEITLDVMNSWVGIILGLVASIIGIISMFLSFYNLDQSVKTQKETLDKIENIKKEIIENVEKNSKETREAYEKSINSIVTTQTKYAEVSDKGGWIHVE